MTQSGGPGFCRELNPSEYPLLARALGDTPETVISVHKLTRGLCKAWVTGRAESFCAAIIQGDDLPEEPMLFGDDADLLWDLLKTVPGWVSPNLIPEVAPAIGAAIEAKMGVSVRYYGDVYHAMAAPAPKIAEDVVRQLTLDDLPLLQATRVGPWAGGYESPRDLLADGVAAGAIIAREIVCIAHTYARSEHHADIGVRTFKAWQSRGFATAAAAIVARLVQEAGQTPVWSAGENNAASLRVAEKLGFREVSRRTYIMPEKGAGHVQRKASV